MNNINTAAETTTLAQAKANKAKGATETAGSLAMNNTPLFAVPVYNYDMFVPTNPFSLNIDFSSYSAEGQENLASNTGFLQGFANAMSTITGFSEGSFAGAGSASATSAGCGGGSCSVGGGFTSVC